MATHDTPSRPVRRVAAACLLTAATLATGALATPAPSGAQAWTDGPCPEGGGVTVVVDFAGFRDEVVVRCAPSPATGYEALEQVGLSYTPTARFQGFLCRIEGHPADDPCQNTPPSDAYWEYWRAEHGGTWAYNQYGPATTSPPPGPVEGWRFASGEAAPPRVAPPAARPAPEPEPEPEPDPEPSSAPEPPPSAPPAPPPPAEPEPEAPPTTTPPAASTPTQAPTSGQADGTEDPTTPDEPTPAAPRHTEDPAPGRTGTPTSPRPSPTATTPDATADDAMDTASASLEDDGGGPPVATLVGVALVAAVGGGAVLVDRRRRRS